MGKGINAHFIRRLYQTVAVPRMLYGANIFLSPCHRNKKIALQPEPSYSRMAIQQFAMVQCRAAILITEGQ